jgi:hypothetical protein
MVWRFGSADRRNGVSVEAGFSGDGPSLFRLPYTKTDCTGVFEVSNNSLATGRDNYPRQSGDDNRLQPRGGSRDGR